ncbi:ATP-dependent DNA helicase [Burkholderia ubonensis]|uniref:ATP-dependent DNA helicase n=1 Tax=Burkholderia ubonensis TaxID=101571 RepID=UPI00075F5A05|nr:ATP-dependent DNA helicase [Burkholderia ubonensis]AOI73353.1 ATP-dependent DNA helicase [Burkholderia ubonensis]KUZ22012.1 ATP-dependent DNA helicase [Burkholderia ubonensis]KUZ37228.1 ATP-dependent DNA helicase [Burkholderia ubonensis]KUZ41937.1 ATP-dependent DNA helicase [Burkholderia ubonensis]KUZ53943.1 ATP-dependent DNA helicase [Burkholderia ubonensis]
MTYVVAVRAMCEFTARRGDLDLRFTPAPTALEGIAGHGAVTSRRGARYETEIPLTGTWRTLTVRGRADGYDPAANRLEEIKTYRGNLDAMPANHRALHWAQAKVYAHLLCDARELPEITVALVYFDIVSERETVLSETLAADVLAAFFAEQCACFVGWAERETAHRAERDAALRALQFPHGQFRSGQRELAVAVYRAARDERCLIAQAPTGIGKTLGTVFPLLKACGEDQLDRVFFLTAKTPGRALALDAATTLGAGTPALPLRVLELVARDKACEHPDNACHGESCPLARGFYDRLAAARDAAIGNGLLDRETVRAAALAHDVCPYYLAQELARWSDMVVGDYNYYYDGSAMLHVLAQQNQWRIGVLVDEAHNLLDRARKMYSGSLDPFAFAAARDAAPAALRKAFERLGRAWGALNRAQQTRYAAYPDIPGPLVTAVQNLVAAIGEHLADAPRANDDALLRFHFDAIQFGALADAFDDASIFDVTLHGEPTPRQPGLDGVAPAGRRRRAQSTLCVRNVIPAGFLAPRFSAARATVLFSGTLRPFHFYRDTLGLPADTGWLDVDGPFRAEQLTVRVASHVSTRWRDRDRSLVPIADLIATQYAARPGNYLSFLSSFDYLQRVVTLMQERHPDVPVWAQAPGMAEAERDAFLARFDAGGRGVGFAVLGGAFSEGVDLAGERLIGAFIATLGLPQVNDVNEQMRRAMDARFGNGYDYIYLYPGLQKVVQAAGRVIRTEQDEGVVHLIDDRYRRREVRDLLPRWWRIG